MSHHYTQNNTTMNLDLIKEDFPSTPTGLVNADAVALMTYALMYSLAVENLDDVNTSNGKIDEAKKLYNDYYESKGQLDDFKKAFSEQEQDGKYQIAVKHLQKVFQRESSPVEIKPVEVTGDVEKDARTALEEYIKLLESTNDVTDMMYFEKDSGALIGAVMEHYNPDCPDFDAFNDASERIAAELDMEGHMKAFQKKTEKFQELFQ